MHGIETELGRPVYGLAENLFRALPVVGTLWSRAGGVAAHPDNAYRLLHDEQQLVLVFPEGTKGTGKLYRDRYQLRRFGRGGFVEIAMRSGVPIIPIAVVGNEEAMPIMFKSRRLAKLLEHPVLPRDREHASCSVPARARHPTSRRSSGSACCRRCYFDVAPEPGALLAQPRDGGARTRSATTIQDALYDMLRQRRSVWLG